LRLNLKAGLLMKKNLAYLALLLSLSLFACQPPPTPTALPSATSETIATETESPANLVSPTATLNTALNAILQEIEGSVQAKDISEADFVSAEDGRTIEEDGQVRTLEDGYTRVDLSSGTLIRMAPLSYFTLVENQPQDDSLFTRIKLEVGQIWIILNGGSLEVETPSGQASVRGSYMMIEIDPETQATLVTCLEGNCSLKNPAGIVELVNGQRAKLDLPDLDGEDFHIPTIEKMSERDFAKWLFFAPEAGEIFPFLEEEGILPWKEWQNYIPETDEDFFNLLEALPDEPLLDGDLLPLDEDGLPLLDGDVLPLDGSLLPSPPDDGDLLPDLPGDGSLLPDPPIGGGDGPLGGGGFDGPLK